MSLLDGQLDGFHLTHHEGPRHSMGHFRLGAYVQMVLFYAGLDDAR